MGRSPSPYRRRFRSPSPQRFGPSRGGDRYRGGDWNDRDRDRDRRDRDWDRDRDRRRDRDSNRDWDSYYRRREKDVSPPSASASASGAAAGAASSRAGSPEEGQITSPEPARDRRRSRSPPSRGYADKFADRYRGGDSDRDRDWDDRRDRDRRGGRDRGWSKRSRSPMSPRRRSPSTTSTRSSRSPRRDSRSISPRRRSPEPRTAPPPLRAVPPSGPRAERPIPTGPRAFNAAPPPPPTITTTLPVGTPGPATAPPSVSGTPRGPPVGYGTPLTPSDAPRPSWADRRRMATSPIASPRIIASPIATTNASASGSSPIPPSGPFTAGPAVSPSVPRTPSIPTPDPSDQEAVARAREARIYAELPVLKIPFIGAWEGDLAAHQSRIAPLVQTTIRAQAAMRVAAAVLADAEAERLAAGERRKVVEEQLNAGSLDGLIGF